MPNHLHGIIILLDDVVVDGRGGSRTAPTTRKRKPLGRLIGAFKTVSTKKINLLADTPGNIIWQRNFYDRIIRNEREWARIHDYILDNPTNWDHDEENPTHTQS